MHVTERFSCDIENPQLDNLIETARIEMTVSTRILQMICCKASVRDDSYRDTFWLQIVRLLNHNAYQALWPFLVVR